MKKSIDWYNHLMQNKEKKRKERKSNNEGIEDDIFKICDISI